MLFFLSTWTEYSTFCILFSDEEDPKKFAAPAPITDAPVVNEPPSQESAVMPQSPEAAAKKAGSRASKRLKKRPLRVLLLTLLGQLFPLTM
jgi:hypothetical protein